MSLNIHVFISLPDSSSICICFCCLCYDFSANIYYLKMINTEHDNTNLVGGDPPLVIFGPQITTFPPLTFSCLISRLLPLWPISDSWIGRISNPITSCRLISDSWVGRVYSATATLLATSTCSSFLDRQSVIWPTSDSWVGRVYSATATLLATSTCSSFLDRQSVIWPTSGSWVCHIWRSTTDARYTRPISSPPLFSSFLGRGK